MGTQYQEVDKYYFYTYIMLIGKGFMIWISRQHVFSATDRC